jgi:Uma2 family endonuclease
MTPAEPIVSPMTASAYLAWEGKQVERHEFWDGRIVAMAGGSVAHDAAIINVLAALKPKLKGSSCTLHGSSFKLHVDRANCYFYPDAFVSCGVTVASDALFVSDATVIVEVLSPSTSHFDHFTKFAKYKLLPGFQEYLLIDPLSQNVVLFRRDPDGRWFQVDENSLLSEITLTSVGVTLTRAELFDGVPLPDAATS